MPKPDVSNADASAASSQPALTAADVNTALHEMWPESNNICAEISPTHALVRADLATVSLRPGGFVPGPAQFGVADAVLWYLVFGALNRIEPMALTSELSIRYLRPGVGSVMYGLATLEKMGRRSMVGSFHVWTDDNKDKPCSTGQGTYMLPQ